MDVRLARNTFYKRRFTMYLRAMNLVLEKNPEWFSHACSTSTLDLQNPDDKLKGHFATVN